MRIAIIDYRAGNLGNVLKTVNRLGHQATAVAVGTELARYDAAILPGVGAFRRGMENLAAAGFVDGIREHALDRGKPFLGICLGMQLLATTGTEGGEGPGLDILPVTVQAFDPAAGLRVPHIGWNSVNIVPGSLLFADVPQSADFYFVHSYYVACEDSSLVSAYCDYGRRFVAAMERDNIFAAQFHPEKSQRYGLQVLQNFLTYCEAPASAG